MAAPISEGTAKATTFFNLDSLEKQAMYLLVEITSQENIYNTANTENQINRATVAVNFDNKTVLGQLALTLTDAAITGKLVDGCVAFLP